MMLLVGSCCHNRCCVLRDFLAMPPTSSSATSSLAALPSQVDFVKLLHDKLMSLSLQRADTPEEWRFPRPSFKVRSMVVTLQAARAHGWRNGSCWLRLGSFCFGLRHAVQQ